MAVPDPRGYVTPHVPPVPPAGPHWNTPLPVGAVVAVRSPRRARLWVAIGVALLVVAVALVVVLLAGGG